MKYVGITETYDPCFVPDWETKLLDANIIISKELNDEMIEKLLITQDRVIFHHTVTGHGNFILEPGVNTFVEEFQQFKKLIERGFPISHYVLRVDPIIPLNDVCLHKTISVLYLWALYLRTNNQRLRCRISMIDMYKHVRERILKETKLPVPWETFKAPKEVFEKVEEQLVKFKDVFAFESCAENDFNPTLVTKIGCASNADLVILNQDPSDYGMPEKKQREDCMCLAKKQILGVRPSRCKHNCRYCFWK